MAYNSTMEIDVMGLQMMVEQAGGEWCGVQKPLVPECETLVLFNHPITHSTLALPIEEMSVIRVREKLREHQDKFEDALKDLKLAVRKFDRLKREK